MKRILPSGAWVAVVSLIGLLAGCGGKSHPVKVFVDPTFQSGSVEKIAVLPFSSALNPTADPNGLAPRTFDQLFQTELAQRTDYMWSSPTSVEYALDKEGLLEDSHRFVDDWRKKRQANADFLTRLGQSLQVDAVLIGVVETWQKDEVDVRENTAPASYAGATVTIFSVADGHVLFEASDEDMIEGMRSEGRNTQVVRSGSGQIYSDPAGEMYKAPPLDEVAVKVARSLATSIPTR